MTDFISTSLRNYVERQVVASTDERRGVVLNPSDGSVVASVALGGGREIDAAALASH